MEPDDDPEARIRDLERPLADSARASEFGGTESGGSGYPPYPPPPPGPVPPPVVPSAPSYGAGYGAAFPGATPRSATGNRVFWIVAAFFVVGMLVAVGGVAVYVARHVHRSNFVVLSPTPTTSAPGVTARSPIPPGSATRTATAGPSTPPPGGSISVAGVNEHKTIACNDSDVSVSGISNTVVITGHCASLDVSGMQNSVTVDEADTIAASGFDNEVTYHSGSPKITKAGDSNEVERG
ncbi:DUF3060 domain-containing protein [Mycobacterium shinjukuense]|nr:DUF3060 domain-containing protein [Mycobacterium shinjukuense]MCV6986235.1 DUF3060 domain-containing protein [Mycobacterium shinjukuense]